MKRGLTVRMAVASGLLAILVAVAFLLLFFAIADLRASTDLRRETRQELVVAEHLEKLLIDLESGLRGFVITREERFLEPWDEARDAFPEAAQDLERKTLDNAGQLVVTRRLIDGIEAYLQEYAVPLLNSVRRNDRSATSVARTAEGKRRTDALRADFIVFAATGRALLTEREASAETAATRATAAAAIGVTGSILLILLFTGYLARMIVLPLRRSAQMADRLAAGELGARMPERGVGEIGALQRSFNAMAGSLEASEAQLRRLLEQQSALRRVATLVARTATPSEVFEAVTREVALLCGADLARMGRYEADGTVTVVAAWNRGRDDPPFRVGTRYPLEGPSIAALVQQTSGPARIDALDDAPGPLADEARKRGVRSSVGCPIVVAGRIWGVIAASSKKEAPFPPDTESQIAEFTELVATAIANAEGRAEVAASRRRIVAASDEARRRIERDLHDGVQQRLVSLGLELQGMKRAMPRGHGLEAQLGRIADGLDGAFDDIVEIARGIHPAILSHGSLRPALEALARRSAVPVELEADLEGRFPEDVEVAAYYIVSEALTNVAKHAEASSVHVQIGPEDGVLRLSVRDDGVGDVNAARGSGLVGLRDRVEALGGSIEITSPPGVGTRLVAELPLSHRTDTRQGEPVPSPWAA